MAEVRPEEEGQKLTSIGTDPKSLSESSNTNRWSTFMFEAYGYRRTPILGSVDIKKVEDAAREKMKDRMGEYHLTILSCHAC